MTFSDFENIFCDIMPILYKASPTISTLIGSPITHIIISLLAAIANCDPTDSKTIADKLHIDPDLYSKLEKLESTHAKWLKDLQSK